MNNIWHNNDYDREINQTKRDNFRVSIRYFMSLRKNNLLLFGSNVQKVSLNLTFQQTLYFMQKTGKVFSPMPMKKYFMIDKLTPYPSPLDF